MSLQETHFSETISCRNNGHGPRQCNKAAGDNFKIFSDFTITCPFDTTIGCQSCIYDHFTRNCFSTAIWLKLHSKKLQHQKYCHKMLTAKLHYSTFRLITSSLTVWFRAWTKANEKKKKKKKTQYLYFNDVNLCCFCLGEFCHNHPGRLSETNCNILLARFSCPCNPPVQPWSEHILENKSLALFLHFHHCYLPQVYTIFKRCYFLGIFSGLTGCLISFISLYDECAMT